VPSKLLNALQVSVLLSFEDCRELGGALLVLFKLLDSLLEPRILEIVCLFLKFEIKKLFFCLEETILDLSCGSLGGF